MAKTVNSKRNIQDEEMKITVERIPDGNGDEEFIVSPLPKDSADTWIAISAVVAAMLEDAGFSKGHAIRAAIPATKAAQEYLWAKLRGCP